MTNLTCCLTGEKLLTLKQRLQLAMAQRRQEERARKAELNRLDNEDCGEEEDEEEEEDMTDESGEEEVGAPIGALYAFVCDDLDHVKHFPFMYLCVHIASFNKNVDDLLGGAEAEDEDEGSVAQSVRSTSPAPRIRPSPTPDLVHTDSTLILFPANSCSRTGYIAMFKDIHRSSYLFSCKFGPRDNS